MSFLILCEKHDFGANRWHQHCISGLMCKYVKQETKDLQKHISDVAGSVKRGSCKSFASKETTLEWKQNRTADESPREARSCGSWKVQEPGSNKHSNRQPSYESNDRRQAFIRRNGYESLPQEHATIPRAVIENERSKNDDQ